MVPTWRERQKNSPLDFVADTTGKFISVTAKNRIHFPLHHKDEDESEMNATSQQGSASLSLSPTAGSGGFSSGMLLQKRQKKVRSFFCSHDMARHYCYFQLTSILFLFLDDQQAKIRDGVHVSRGGVSGGEECVGGSDAGQAICRSIR